MDGAFTTSMIRYLPRSEVDFSYKHTISHSMVNEHHSHNKQWANNAMISSSFVECKTESGHFICLCMWRRSRTATGTNGEATRTLGTSHALSLILRLPFRFPPLANRAPAIFTLLHLPLLVLQHCFVAFA